MKAIVPLIVAGAAPAATIVTLPTGNYSCSYTVNALSGTGSACDGGATALPGATMNGVGFWLAQGGLDLGSQGGSIIMDTIGREPAIATGTVIPVSWVFDFALADSIGPADPAWQLTYTVDDVTTDTILAHQTFSGNDFGLVTGDGLVTTTASSSGRDLLDVRVKLLEGGDPGAGYDIQVRIPEFHTIDVGSVPEPATFGFVGAGLAMMGWQARKRRSRLN